MIDIEKIKAEQAKEIAEAELRNVIETSLPTSPYRVMTFGMRLSCPWVTYKVSNLAEAVALADTFEWVPYAYAENGCSVVRPDELLGEYSDRVKLVFDGAPMLQLETCDAHIYSSTLTFYTRIAERLLCVKIEMAIHPARIGVVVLGDGRGRRPYLIRKDYPRDLHEDKRIVWGTGGEKSASATYIWATNDTYRSALNEIFSK